MKMHPCVCNNQGWPVEASVVVYTVSCEPRAGHRGERGES